MNAPDHLTNLRVNPDWAKLPLFDRSKWQRVRFGDVVENLNETCDPAEAGIERYIGLEHLGPGSLHIRGWGNVSDGTTFTRRARPGQVLFGKRRAYQRKIAVASFDAVVSGDIYVLAPKNDRLLGDLLPLLCMSDRFFNHAVGTSAGSLSPRTNWTSLASFEFDLPTREQQIRAADTLTSIQQLEEKWAEVAYDTERAVAPIFESEFPSEFRAGNGRAATTIPPGWSLCRIRELVQRSEHSLLAGPFGTIFKAKDFRSEGVRIIQLRHVTERGFVWGQHETYMDLDVYERLHKPYTVRGSDLLITKMGGPPGLACVYPEGGPLAMVTPDVIKASVDPAVADVRFLKHLYNSPIVRKQVAQLVKGATRPRVDLTEFFALSLPIPSLEVQERIVAIAESCVEGAVYARETVQQTRNLLMQSTEALFSRNGV